MVVMEIQLKKDNRGLSAEFVEGLDCVSQNNAGNNIVRVILDGFELAEGEVLRIAYATTDNEHDVETENVGFTLMTWNSATGDYEILLDQIVLRKRGEWLLDLQIASEWNETANDYSMKLHLNEKLSFTVKNALYDATGGYPKSGDITALYTEAVELIKAEKRNAQDITALQKDKVSKSGDAMTDTLTIIERESSTTANPGLIIRNKETAGIDLIAFSSDGTIQRIKKGKVIGWQVLPDKAGTLATLDDVTEIGEEKVSKTGDEMTGPLRVSSARSLEKAQLQNNGVEVGVLDAEKPVKTWYANGFILRTKDGKDVYIALPDKDGTLITADDIATVREAAEDALSIAKGANQSLSYGDYATLISTLNVLPKTALNVGQNLYIFTVGVPDLWVAKIVEPAEEYVYTTDEDFINALNENGFVQVGYYIVAQLETQEAAITDCVKFTDYMNTGKAGVASIYRNGAVYSGISVNKNGELVLVGSATTGDLSISDAVISNPKPYGVAITAPYLYKWIKQGIAYNDETLTDDTKDEDGNVVKGEKTKACEWLGAVPKLPSKSYPIIYMQDTVGQVQSRGLGSQPGFIPYMRTPGETTNEPVGTLIAATPEGDWDCAPKKYVADGFVPRRIAAHSLPTVYAQKADGTETQYNLLQAPSQGSSGIPLYFNDFIDGTGYYLQVAVGLVPTKEYSATSKKYVDENKGTTIYSHKVSGVSASTGLVLFNVNSTPYTSDTDLQSEFSNSLKATFIGKTVISIQRTNVTTYIIYYLSTSNTIETFNYDIAECTDQVTKL